MPKTYWFSHGAGQISVALTVLLMEGAPRTLRIVFADTGDEKDSTYRGSLLGTEKFPGARQLVRESERPESAPPGRRDRPTPARAHQLASAREFLRAGRDESARGRFVFYGLYRKAEDVKVIGS